MANGLLINYAGVPHEISSLFPDNGLASLAAVLEKENQNVKIFDYSTITTIRHVYSEEIKKALAPIAPIVFGSRKLNEKETVLLLEIEDEIKRTETHFLDRQVKELHTYIEKNDVSWIGFKLWIGSINQSMYLAKGLKRLHPGLKIFCGGPSVDIFQQALLKKFPFVDTLVFAEAEKALPSLVKWTENKEKISQIPNIIYKDDDKFIKNKVMRINDLDALPYPIYDQEIYPAMKYDQKMKIYCFDESRGCPRSCAFCPGVNKYGSRRIEKSANRCISELCYLKEKYGATHYRFSGSNTSVKLLSEIAEGLVAKKVNISFAVFSSAVGLSADMIEQLVKAGLYSIFVGVESANSHKLKVFFEKPQSLDRLREVFESCKKKNIFISTSMIYPGPFSDKEDLSENMNYLLECFKGYDNCSVALYPAGLYPYSKWFSNLEKFGFSLQCSSKEEYITQLIDYAYSIVLPRYLWKELPYSLNDKSFKQLLLETNEMGVRLQNSGVLTYSIEANLIMAPVLGYDDYKEFAKEANIAFFSGDAKKLEMWNEKFNRKTRYSYNE